MFQPNPYHRPNMVPNRKQRLQPFQASGQPQHFHHQPFPQQQYPVYPQQGQQSQPFAPTQQGPQALPGAVPKKASFFKSAFVGENGKFDVGRTVQTMDQVVKTMHQVSPIVKQVSGFFIKK